MGEHTDKWLTVILLASKAIWEQWIGSYFSWNYVLPSKRDICTSSFPLTSPSTKSLWAVVALCAHSPFCISQDVTLTAHVMWSELSEKLLGQARKEVTAACLMFCCVWVESNCHFPDLRPNSPLEGQTSCFHQHRKLQGLEYTGRGSHMGAWDTKHLTACSKLKKQK